jgi:chemotaxis protein CheD
MAVETNKETIVGLGQLYVTKNVRELLKAVRVATSVVVVVYDPQSSLGGMAHMALPDSKMTNNPGESPFRYVDLALPQFVADLVAKGLNKTTAQIKIIGGSQLFNFGGGAGNILNIGTRNAITARTILTREGIQVEKTETGGNKPRTVILELSTGYVQVFHPGENPRYI